MKKAVLYVRVSSKEQIEGSSLETQERICTDYALRNEFEIDKIFIEKGESAKTIDRTELKALLEYVHKNSKNLEAVIIHKVDRLARNSYDHAYIKHYFNNFGIKLISATENLEDTPVGRLIENQLAGFAQFDNEIRAERCKNGMLSAVKAGRWVWKAPLGYVNIGGRGISNITPAKPDLVDKIRKIWVLLDTGLSPEEARRAITKEGLRAESGNPISKSHFHRMIRNKAYIGIIEKFGLTIVGTKPFKGLVNPELFLRVQGKLNDKAKNMPVYKKDNEDFPLRGIVVCNHCAKRLTASWSRGNGGKFAYYRCLYCKGINYKKDVVESKFMQFLKLYSYKPELKEMLIKAIEVNLEHRNESNKNRVKAIDKELLQLKAKEKQIAEKNFRNVLSDILAKEMLDDSGQKISELTLELDKYKNNQEDTMKVVKHSLSVLEDISGVWFRVDLDIKKRFQKFLFPEGVPFDGENYRTTKSALCIEPKWTMTPQKFHLVSPSGLEPETNSLKGCCSTS